MDTENKNAYRITEDELDTVFEKTERIEEIGYQQEYIPTVEDLQAHQVDKNMNIYLPYLIYISDIVAGAKYNEHKKVAKYISQLVNECVIAA